MRRLFLPLMLLLASLPAQAQRVPQSEAEISMSFAPVVRAAAPAVVNIYARTLREAPPGPFADDPFFGRFFREFGRGTPQVENSLGSGVILSPDGIVVSNYHVVGTATEIRVVLADRREFDARVLLGDAENDLAILRIEGVADLPHLPLRASDEVEVGELALAIGNPFGVGQTVTSGIISGLARSGAAARLGQGYFIQTDAPINPGNSGGALVDMAGRLIGVNTSILTRSGGSNGIGFAIPADLVAAFMRQAQDGKTRFERPWAGMSGQPVDPDMAEVFGLDRPGGIVISGLHEASPFAAAGVAVGDIIVAVEEQPVNTPAEMIYRMSVAGAGERAEVDILRDGAVLRVDVALRQAPDVPPRDSLVLGPRDLLEGVTLARVNPAVIDEYNLPLESAGVIVTEAGPLGRRVGLRAGDVIEQINDRVVGHPEEVARAFRARARAYALVVVRAGQRRLLRFGA